MRNSLIFIVFSIGLLMVTGCSSLVPSFYETDIRQGNYIDRAMLDELKAGMTKSQVQLLLGTPLLSDPFHADRWDYIYRFQSASGQVEQRRVSLFFEGELLSRIEGNLNP